MSQFQAAKPGFPMNPVTAKVQSKMLPTPAGMKARPPLTAGLVPGTLNPGVVSGVGRPQFPRPVQSFAPPSFGSSLVTPKLHQMPGRPFAPGPMTGSMAMAKVTPPTPSPMVKVSIPSTQTSKAAAGFVPTMTSGLTPVPAAIDASPSPQAPAKAKGG